MSHWNDSQVSVRKLGFEMDRHLFLAGLRVRLDKTGCSILCGRGLIKGEEMDNACKAGKQKRSCDCESSDADADRMRALSDDAFSAPYKYRPTPSPNFQGSKASTQHSSSTPAALFLARGITCQDYMEFNGAVESLVLFNPIEKETLFDLCSD